MFSRIINLTSFYVNRILNKVEDPAAALAAEHETNVGALTTMQAQVLKHHAERIKLQTKAASLQGEVMSLNETLVAAKASGQDDIARDAARSLVAFEDELAGITESLTAVIAIGDELERQVAHAQIEVNNRKTEGTLLIAQHNAAKATLTVRQAAMGIGQGDTLERVRAGVIDTAAQVAALGEMESRGSLGTGISSSAALKKRLAATTTEARINEKLSLTEAV